MRRFVMAAAVTAGLLAPASAGAVVLYDSGDGTHQSSSVGDPFGPAARFVFGSAVTLTDIEGFINTQPLSEPGDSFRVSVLADAAGGTPGGALFSTSVVGLDPDGTETHPFWQGAHGLSWSLAAGAYWIAFDAAPGSDFLGVLWGGAPNPVARYATHSSGPWQPLAGSPALAVRFSGEGGDPITAGDPWPPGPPLPEPEAWALMLLGFGGVGAVLRRRRLADMQLT